MISNEGSLLDMKTRWWWWWWSVSVEREPEREQECGATVQAFWTSAARWVVLFTATRAH